MTSELQTTEEQNLYPALEGFEDPKEKLGKRTNEAWVKYLSTPYQHMTKNALEFATRVHSFRQECAKHRKPFGEAADLWLSLNKDAASEWSLIGGHIDRLKTLEFLPPGRKVLAQLSRLNEETFAEFQESVISHQPFGQMKLEKFIVDYNNRLGHDGSTGDSDGGVDDLELSPGDDDQVVNDKDQDPKEPKTKSGPGKVEEYEPTASTKSDSEKLEDEYNGAIDDMAGLFIEYPEIPAMLQSYFHPDKPTGNEEISAKLNGIVSSIRKYIRTYADVED